MDSLPVSIPPAFWFLSFLANIIFIPASIWFFKTYLPARDARKKVEFEAGIKAQENERIYYQSTGNVAIDILREITTERSREVNELTRAIMDNTKVINRLDKQVENLARSVTTLAGAIDHQKNE